MKTIEEMLKDYTEHVKKWHELSQIKHYIRHAKNWGELGDIEVYSEHVKKWHESVQLSLEECMEYDTEEMYGETKKHEKIKDELFPLIVASEEFYKLDRKVQLLYSIADRYNDCVEFVDNGIRVRNLDGDFDHTYATIEKALIDYLDTYVETFYEESGSWEEDIDFLREIKNNFK